MSEQTLIHRVIKLLHRKDEESNAIAAAFPLMTMTLVSMSLVDLTWYKISGDVCVPYLTLGQFFWFGYSTDDSVDYSEYDCINVKIVNMMRIIILLCFMTITFSLMGFFLEMIVSTLFFYKLLRKYSVMGICTVLWILSTTSIASYVGFMLEDSLCEVYPDHESSVSFGLGFYLVVASGIISALGAIYSMLVPMIISMYMRGDDRCLLEGSDDSMEVYRPPTPPPTYCIPPPSYCVPPPPPYCSPPPPYTP